LCIKIHMVQVVQTTVFSSWLGKLTDTAAARIVARLRRLELGNQGDVKSVGGGVSEMRIDYGPGYRIYYVRRGKAVVVLLCGGDKRTQAKDIKTAQEMAKEV
jgi:putative addiction module killer protein